MLFQFHVLTHRVGGFTLTAFLLTSLCSIAGAQQSQPPVPAPAPVEPKRPESKGTSVTDMGRWTILRPMANCATTYYTWHSVGDTFTFRDQAGQTDTEQVLERRPGGATTRTLASRRRGAGGQPAGTRWDYHFQSDGSVRVRNLSSGKNFVLIKCP